jgi:sugar phosphate isomerase/epimerase
MSILVTAIALMSSWSAPATQPAGESVHPALPPFFAMDTATRDAEHQSIESQVQLVKELGFDGWGPAYKPDLPDTLKIMDRSGVRLSALYVPLTFDANGPKCDPTLARNMELLRGRGTIIWLVVRSEKKAPQSPENDKAAVTAIREVATLAEPVGLQLAIYPHMGDYVAGTRDALRMVKAVDRPNVGLSFNLCHWLRVDGYGDLQPLLKEMMPHLFVVSINGADRRDPDFKNWNRYIQPLGEGDFDVQGLMKSLRSLGYRGPVGLQGFGLKGSVQEHLAQAIRVWKEYGDRIGREK